MRAALESEGEVLAARLEMPVRVFNRIGAAAVGEGGTIHFIKRANFEIVK